MRANHAGLVGDIGCTDVGIRWSADDSYAQPRDFAFGSWACVRGYLGGLGSHDTSIKVWIDDQPILDIEGLDSDFLSIGHGVGGYMFNNYANANQELNGAIESPTSETTYRYQDNIHIREGVPVSCAQLGM